MLYALNADDNARVIVVAIVCLLNEHVTLLTVGNTIAEDIKQLLVFHVFQHTVGTEIEVVALLYVGDVDDVCLRTPFLVGHDDTCDNVLVLGSLHLVLRQLANLKEVVDERVVT